MRLEQRKVRGKKVFPIASTADSADTNVSLHKFVLKDFGWTLPEFALSEEGEGSVEAYFGELAVAVEGLKRWRICRFLTLGHFAFGRLAMYEDLNPENWAEHPAGHTLVRAILSGVDSAGDGELPSVPSDYEIDTPEVEMLAPVLVHDADASQHSAVVDVMKAQNLVVEGPPGTGKSQTITNAIANALYQGRSILFLAEKLAALEVVKRRLDRAGLGEFCLELHSEKATPRLVVESLRRRYELRRGGHGPVRSDPRSWEDARRDLSGYVGALHATDTDGRAPFDLFWSAIAGATKHGDLPVAFRATEIGDRILGSPDEAIALSARLRLFAEVAAVFEESFGPPRSSRWDAFAFDHVPRYAAPEVLDNVASIGTAATALMPLLATAPALGIKSLSDLDLIGTLVELLPDPPPLDHIEAIRGADPFALADALAKRKRLDTIAAELGGVTFVKELSDDEIAIAIKLSSLSWRPEISDASGGSLCSGRRNRPSSREDS